MAGPLDAEALGDLDIEQLMDVPVEKVYGASKYEQKVTQAPASVTIVSRDEIRVLGYRTLAEVLRGLRGIYVTYDRNYSNIGVRGFGRPGDFNTRVLLMVDGHRMNDNLYDSALIGIEGILDVDLIERVEVIRGPSSSIYGNNAFLGVINVITRNAAELDGIEASAEGGSTESYKGRLTYGNQFRNGTAVIVSGSHYESQGNKRLYYPEFDAPESNRGVAEDNDGERAQNLYGALTVGDWVFSAAYSRRDKDIPTASFGTVFNDGRERATDERIFTDLKYKRALLGSMRLQARAYYDYYAYKADYPFNFAGPGQPPFVVVTHDDTYGDGVGTEVQVTHRHRDRHTLVAGAEYRKDLNLYQSNYTDDPQTYSFQDNRSRHSIGVYAQEEYALRSNLLLNAGLRYDHYSNFGSAISPRLGLIWQPWAKTTAKALYGQAYRAPNAFELYQESPGYSKANPELKPEKITTYEVVLDHYMVQHFSFSIAAYHYGIRDLISQEQDPADGLVTFNNKSQLDGNGVEVGMTGIFADDWFLRASHAVQRAEDGDTGEELSNSPRHLTRINLIAPLWSERLRAGLELQGASSSKTVSGSRTGGFVLANLTLLSEQVLDRLDLSASVYNLLDRDYAYPGSTGHRQSAIPQDGRSFRLKATYRF